jgi:hypothetical protein
MYSNTHGGVAAGAKRAPAMDSQAWPMMPYCGMLPLPRWLRAAPCDSSPVYESYGRDCECTV